MDINLKRILSSPINIFWACVLLAAFVVLILWATGNLYSSEAFTMSPEEEGQPMMEQPMMEQPVMEQPVMEQPVMEQPMMEQPVIEQPVMEQPMMELPTTELPTTEVPMTPPTDEEEQKRKMNEYLTQLAEYEQKYKAELEKNAALREEGYIY